MIKRKKQQFISEKEVQQLLSFIKNKADLARKRGTSRAIVDELIIILLLNAGLRPNEVCTLRIKDLPGIHGEKSIWIQMDTAYVNRKVDISEDMVESLKRFVRLYRKGANKKDFLMESERGNQLGYMSLYNKIYRIGKESGIGRLSPSILRNTYVKRLYEAEQDLRYVQEQAGYANCRTLYKLVNNDNTKTSQKCDACGVTIIKGSGKRIDSGQLLCRKCLKNFPRY